MKVLKDFPKVIKVSHFRTTDRIIIHYQETPRPGSALLGVLLVVALEFGSLVYLGFGLAFYQQGKVIYLYRMKEMWAYDKQPRFDHSGKRWHFVRRDFYATNIPYEDRPVELYFRDDERKEFGLLRFERQKDIPFRDYEVMINKVMNDREFRATLIAPETSTVWNRNWK